MSTKSISLTQVRGLTASEVSRLKKVGIDSTGELLAAAPDTRAEQALAKKAGLTLTRMREAVNRADLIQVSGLGPATADLLENVGVNSAKELAQRNSASLYAAVDRYLDAHPELNYRQPSATSVATYVANAKALFQTGPATVDEARLEAGVALRKHLDGVLFSNHPDGANFREAVLWWRDEAGQKAFRAEMLAGIDALTGRSAPMGDSMLDEVYENEKVITFAGRWSGLYTEVYVPRDGSAPSVYVEID